MSTKYTDETKSTLLFASRAKRVTTNAKVHEVISDEQSMIRRLQKELDDVRLKLLEHTQQPNPVKNRINIPTAYDEKNMKDQQASHLKLMREKEERFNRLVLQATNIHHPYSSLRRGRNQTIRRMTFGHSLQPPAAYLTDEISSPFQTKPKRSVVAPNTTGRPFRRSNEDAAVVEVVRIGNYDLSSGNNPLSASEAALHPHQELRLLQESLAVQRTQRQIEEESLREVIKEQNTAVHEKDELISKLKQRIAFLEEENANLRSAMQQPSGMDLRNVSDKNTKGEIYDGKPSRNIGVTDDLYDEEDSIESTSHDSRQVELISAWKRFISVECDDSRLKSAWAIFVRHFALYVVWSYVFEMPKHWWPDNNNDSPANRIRYTYADRSEAEKLRFDNAALNAFKIPEDIWDRVKKDGDIKKFTGGMKRRSKNGRLPKFQIVAELEFGLVDFLDGLWPDRTLIRETEHDDDDDDNDDVGSRRR
jgi:hypothetical protein